MLVRQGVVPGVLAADSAMAGHETHVSVRHGLVFQPKTLFGRPRSELPLLARLPVRLQERVTRSLIDVAPLRLVADCLLLGRTTRVEAVHG